LALPDAYRRQGEIGAPLRNTDDTRAAQLAFVHHATGVDGTVMTWAAAAVMAAAAHLSVTAGPRGAGLNGVSVACRTRVKPASLRERIDYRTI